MVKPYKIGTTITDNILAHGVGGYNESACQMYWGDSSNIFTCDLPRQEAGLHPSQKPLKLMKALIEMTTSEDQLVLDPFAGSGSTLVAAKETNRRYIGFEIDAEYHRVAQERLHAQTVNV